MVAWFPFARRAFRAAPVAMEVARRVDREVRPHLLAYRLAEDVDGYVARWTGAKGRHWLVFARPDGPPVRAFPPLLMDEEKLVERELDRTKLRHHSELPEARLKQQGTSVASLPGRLAARIGRGDSAHR